MIPFDDVGAGRLLAERRLLATLAPRLSFAVPTPIGDVDGPLDLRRRVPGETGMHLYWSTLEDPDRARAYADDLARVFAELHTALDRDETRALAGDAAPTSIRCRSSGCARWSRACRPKFTIG